jgi:hypothetical protein
MFQAHYEKGKYEEIPGTLSGYREFLFKLGSGGPI